MRVTSWFLVGLALLALVIMVGAAVFTYVGVRQFVADSPIQLPTLDSPDFATPSQLIRDQPVPVAAQPTIPATVVSTAIQQQPNLGTSTTMPPASLPSIPLSAVSTTSPTPLTPSAVIQVSNGAGIDGLAKAYTDKLHTLGFNVLPPKNADLPGGYALSQIRVYTGNYLAARQLAQALGLSATLIYPGQNGPTGTDIELIVGKDLAPTSTPSS